MGHISGQAGVSRARNYIERSHNFDAMSWCPYNVLLTLMQCHDVNTTRLIDADAVMTLIQRIIIYKVMKYREFLMK